MNITRDDAFSSPHTLESHEGIAQYYSTTTITLWIITLVTAAFIYSVKSKSNPFRDMDGIPIKRLKADTRYTRFAQSLQLSIDGKNLAQDEPYLIRNVRHWELVIHTPEQVREFYRKDGKDH
ncbi:hypothetical protein ABVK25_012119 [Lepraria finkii]|uniref:Small integral membrane protein 19 n=1 Tax=Lepraria finkii TaxID=1340010 RepID=A0ABR4AL85_9LECA